MAEIVQQVLESSIQELTVLEKYNLFESDEIKAILKKRREFEYRLRKVKKSKDDFLRYITYEESLLKLIRIRREKSGLEIDKNEIEKSVLDRIRNLFEFTINKFKSDIPLWLSYINFNKNQNHFDQVSMLYFRMLQVHNKDWLWLQFAKFEFEERASSETARKVFLRAISFHSDSKQVWHEYFRFELLYCSKIQQRYKILASSNSSELDEKQEHDAIWNGQLACIVYKHAINVFTDFEFASSFIDICNKLSHETTKEVKIFIFDNLKSRFGSCEKYYNALAWDKFNTLGQRVRFGGLTEEEHLKLKQETIAEVVSIFEKACLNFDNAEMWSYYITFRLEDLKNTDDTDSRILKMSEIIFTLDKLWKQNKVAYSIFVEWIMLMYLCNKKELIIIQKIHLLLKEASERWPDNLDAHLFIACIMVKLPDKKISDSIIEKFFHDCLSRKFTKVTEENLDAMMDFWQLYLDWSVQNKLSYSKIIKMVSQLNDVSIYAPRKMSEYFKSKVLAIIFHQFGIKKARSYYQKNKTTSPISRNFSYKMIEIEKHVEEMQEEKTEDFSNSISSAYEDLIHHFGKEDVYVWLDYIRHIMTIDTTKVGALYEKALKSLSSGLCQQFVQQYSLLKSSSIKDCEFA